MLLLAAGSVGLAQEQLPAPQQVTIANDEEDLSGGTVKVAWQPVAPDQAPPGYRLVGYGLFVGESASALKQVNLFLDAARQEAGQKGRKLGKPYYAQVSAIYVPASAKLEFSPDDPNLVTTPGVQEGDSEVAGPAQTVSRWYDPQLTNVLVGVLLLSVLTLVTLYVARTRELYVRPIAGLQAVDDAIGRATEMGKPILYVSGLGGASDIATIAAMLVLGHLARKTAPYGTDLLVPATDPMVMTAEREIVQQAYLHAGRPDAYKAENIFYITDSQFGFVSAVAGIMVRERPAANFYMGYFAAESLVLAETGNTIDALQIAGTDSDTQLPFFITACDYTLMGEELYAASAYLSRDPVLLAQLKAQDLGKLALAALLVLGVLGGLALTHWAPELGEAILALLKT